MTIENPKLTFFCELPVQDLKKLFSTRALIKQLRRMEANISMGCLDFSSERADIVRRLTKAGIPVTAWLLLPKELGYWTSLDTVAQTAQAYGQFVRWTLNNQLKWAAVGLDIEPELKRAGIFTGKLKKELPDIFHRLLEIHKYSALEYDLRALINRIRSDGFAVETYNLPFIVDERKAHSRILARIFGTPPLESDREVLMLYSSAFVSGGDKVLLSYAKQAQAIGLGSTGGGVELENNQPMRPMTWHDLQRDLLIARRFTKNIYIFSLEGCVQNGYLDDLESFNWFDHYLSQSQTINKVSLLRKIGQALLWILDHPIQVLLSGVLIKLFVNPKKG